VFYFSRGEQVVLIILMLALLGGVGALLYNQGHASAGTDQPFFVEPAVGREDTGVVLVHVAGEVRRPGVYSLKANSRVRDALAAAGGPTAKADLDALNLAGRVSDEQKLLVRARQPEALVASPTPTSSPPAASRRPASSLPRQPISINKAGEQELEQLPGIGPTYARNIVEYRRQLQRTKGCGFTCLEELMEVPGIGPKRFAQLKPYVRL
jgi:competence protein ComEA